MTNLNKLKTHEKRFQTLMKSSETKKVKLIRAQGGCLGTKSR